MKTFFYFLALAAALSSAAILPGCGKKMSEEDRVWAVVTDMAGAAEVKDIGRLKGHISKSYHDTAGNDYDRLKGLILYQFLNSGDITVFLRKHEITVDGGRAHVMVRAVISRGKKLKDIPETEGSGTGGFVFDLDFSKEGSDWLLTSAAWRQVGIAEAL